MGNNSGVNRVVINQLERAASGDINLIQQKLARAMQMRFQRMMSDEYADADVSNTFEQRGVATPQNLVQSPLNGDVYGGLLVRIAGATDLRVNEGILGSVSPVGADDGEDSEYTFIDDPGIVPGTLIFAPNPGPGVRIDVIECDAFESTLLSEPRDIFDVPTQTFVPTPVDKAKAARLNYRIRQGTAGVGYPGHVAGWLPLAIAIHPAASGTFADVDFFDVRPLVADLARSPTKRGLAGRACRVDRMVHGLTISGANDLLAGVYDVEGTGASIGNQGPYVCQGTIKSTIPGAANAYNLDLTDTDNFASGYSPGANEWSYVVALFPEGLPRWVHYATTDAGQGERLPENTMGVITVSGGPISGAGLGTNGSLITPPTVTGLLSAAPGKLVALTRRNTVFATNDYLETAQSSRGDYIVPASATEFNVTGGVTGSTTTTETVDYVLGDIGIGTLIPASCVGIWVNLEHRFTFSAQNQLYFDALILNSNGNSRYAFGKQGGVTTVTGAIVNTLAHSLFLPLIDVGFGTGFSPTNVILTVRTEWTLANSITFTSRTLNIEAFKLAG